MKTDTSGTFSALWRPYHYIGLELAQSIYSIALNSQATGKTKFLKQMRPLQKIFSEKFWMEKGVLLLEEREQLLNLAN